MNKFNLYYLHLPVSEHENSHGVKDKGRFYVLCNSCAQKMREHTENRLENWGTNENIVQNKCDKCPKENIKPEVGMGGTIAIWTDCYPVTIVDVHPSGKLLTIQRDNFKRIDSNGPFTEAQDYEITRNPNGPKERFTLRKNGRWVRVGESMRQGTRLGIGNRRAYNDPCF